MKKIIVAACLSILPFSHSIAEGYQANVQSTKQSGMGHVGVAMKLGAESMHFNPAGLAFMNDPVGISVGASGVFSNVKYTNGAYSHETDNKMSTPLYAYVGFKIFENVAAGISLTTPYGSGINYGKNWVGSYLVQDLSLQSFSIQPTVSWKIMDRLSIGAGLMVMTGNFTLSRSLIPAGALEGLRPFAPKVPGLNEVLNNYKDISAASASLAGSADMKLGFNVGAMFDITDRLTVGLSYRSKVMMQVNEGEAELSYANKAELEAMLAKVNPILAAVGKNPIGVPPLDKGTFKAEMPLPSNWNIGLSYRASDRLMLSAETQIVGWSAYQSLNVQFSQEVLGGYSLKAEKNYKNSCIFRIGSEYKTTDRLDLRLGAYYDQSPVEDNFLNPETPSSDKLGLTAGLSFRPVERFSIDAALAYITGFGRDGSYTDVDTTTGQPRTFKGHYDVNALTAVLGLSYAF